MCRAIDYSTPRENYYVPGWKPYYHRFNLVQTSNCVNFGETALIDVDSIWQPITVDDPDENGWWLMSDAEYMSGSGVH